MVPLEAGLRPLPSGHKHGDVVPVQEDLVQLRDPTALYIRHTPSSSVADPVYCTYVGPAPTSHDR